MAKSMLRNTTPGVLIVELMSSLAVRRSVNKAMLVWHTFSTPSSYAPPRTHLNTSSARSLTTQQVTCSNINISSNRTNTERCGNTAPQTNWDDCFRGYATYPAQTPVFSFTKRKSPNTNVPHTAALSAMSGHKRMRSIALDSW